MIGKLKGIVDSCLADHAIIDVQGVGYLVYCSAHTLDKLKQDMPCELYITTHVREDHIHLYGFITYIEKQFFALLQTVNGIGVRMALAILSSLTPEQIQMAIIQKNKDIFKSISGVGAKIAERILIELKDKIKADITLPHIESAINLADNNMGQDSIAALTYLGINRNIAQNLIYNLLAKNPNLKTDELVKLALQDRTKKGQVMSNENE